MNKYKQILNLIKIDPFIMLPMERFSFMFLRKKNLTSKEIFEYYYNDSKMFRTAVDRLLEVYGLEKDISKLTLTNIKSKSMFRLRIKEFDNVEVVLSLENNSPMYLIIASLYSLLDSKLYTDTVIDSFDYINHYNEYRFFIDLLNNADVCDVPYLTIQLLSLVNKYDKSNSFALPDLDFNDSVVRDYTNNMYIKSYITDKDIHSNIYIDTDDIAGGKFNYVKMIISKLEFKLDIEKCNLKKMYNIDLEDIK